MCFYQTRICDIMGIMKTKNLIFLPVLACLVASGAHANWQYSGMYIGDGTYTDDGARFIISVRGGASYGMASIENDMGTLTSEYYYDPATGVVASKPYYDACLIAGGCDDFLPAGVGDLSTLPADQDFSAFTFAAGASLGWTIPNAPQWRVELGWDHINESEYNASPLFEGDLVLSGGNPDGIVINVASGSVHSKMTTDVISAMAFYDFFDGLYKPVQKFIPYVGFGVGYADTKTTLNLTDPYGELSADIDLQNFGDVDDYGVIQFYRSEYSNSNIAGVIAAGVSYGISESMFLDLGARVMYIPRVKWALSNEGDTRNRDWFSAHNLIYANVMLGLRFEF